jgi:plastocyanin
MMKVSMVLLLLIGLASAISAQNKVKYNVFLRSDTGEDTLWDGRIIRVFGLASRLTEEPHIPAKTLYCREGDTVALRTLNISQGAHHTIHLHGLDVDTKNDGDPATSFSLAHMQDTDYTFYARHAGTYLYHCHVADVVHVQMGMYGLLVILPKDGLKTAWTGGPSFDVSYNWILSEVDHEWHDNIPMHDSTADTVHLPLYKPDYFLVNGRSESSVTDDSTAINAKQGQTVYLRLGAIGFFYQRVIFPQWMQARKIDSDGRPLPTSIESDTVEIAPGERYGVLLSMTQSTIDSVLIEYVNMNTDSVWGRQYVRVNTIKSSVNTQHSATLINVYPNPTSSTSIVSVTCETESIVAISLYNTLGIKVLDIYGGRLPLGMSQIEFASEKLTNGLYYINTVINGKHSMLSLAVAQ